MKTTLFFFITLVTINLTMAQTSDHIKKTKSNYSVEETAKKILEIVKSKGLNVFTEISHSEGATKAGLELENTHLIIFGNPKVGTKLMQCDRNMGLMLPLKVLIWSEGDQTYLGHIDPSFFGENFDLDGCTEILEKIRGALNGIVGAATK
ncbi:MAG: DUF302 domain-containing protein [Bacteroidota bacterium]